MRRQLSRVMLVVAVLILFVAGISTLAERGGGNGLPVDGSLVPVPGAVAVPVDRIIDGDTLDVRVAGSTVRVRLYGVDTPERGETCFREATERLRELAGDVVQLLPDARLTDRFGRELRYVYSTEAVLIDEALVVEGFGVAWRDDGSKRAAIIAAEEEARAASRGCLWSAGG
jgi:micrococcal nuclease